MKFYLNLASDSFAELLQSGRFVDNSLVIRELARSMKAPDTKYVCISRPRRFGKTVTANMLCTYYGMGHNAATLFNSLQIAADESYRTHLNQ
ncbi:MAG: AAA family ATPase, partial [Succinivibrio sp.]|nr:AAA family ATPase [Succinivibrio sp.]